MRLITAVVVAALIACKRTPPKPTVPPGAEAIGKACRLHNQNQPAGDVGVWPTADILQQARDNRDNDQALKALLPKATVVGAHEHCTILNTQGMDFAHARQVRVTSGAKSGSVGWVFHDWALTESEWKAAGIAAPFE